MPVNDERLMIAEPLRGLDADDMRREVAARLRAKYRERAQPGFFEPQDMMLYHYNYLKDLESCLPDGESMFTLLADLIEPGPEPTCRDDGPEDAFRCSRCGAFALRDAVADLCGPIPIRFCPNCGAAVVAE